MWRCLIFTTRAHETTFVIWLLYWFTSKREKDRRKEFESSSATESQLYCRYVPWLLQVQLWLCCLPDLALPWTAVWSISAAEWEKLAPCCALLVREEGKRDRGRVLAWLLNGEFVIYDRATEISVQEEFILAHTHTHSQSSQIPPVQQLGLLLCGFSGFSFSFPMIVPESELLEVKHGWLI